MLVFGVSAPIEGGNVSRAVMLRRVELQPRGKVSLASLKEVHTIDFSGPENVARHDKMVELVKTMLELHKRLTKVKMFQSRDRLQRQTAATDQAIDQLVYELYDLTEEEIALAEDATGRD